MAYKKLRKNGILTVYAFYVRVKGKRERERVSCYASEVDAVYLEWEKKKRLGNVQRGKQFFTEVSQKFLEWAQTQKRPKAFAADQRHLKMASVFFGNKSIEEIRRTDIVDFRGRNMSRGIRPATANRVTATLSHFFNWCIDREIITSNPATRQRIPEMNDLTRTPPNDKVKEILEIADSKLKDWVYLAIFTGMRMGEIGRLRWNQVNLDNGLIRLNADETKGKRERVLPLPNNLVKYLTNKRENAKEEIYVIGGMKPLPGCGSAWRRLRKNTPWMKEMNLKFHDLRHVYATTLRMSGVNLHEVQVLLGHSDIKTTQRYAKYQGQVGRDVVANLDVAFGQNLKISQNPEISVQRMSNVLENERELKENHKFGLN